MLSQAMSYANLALWPQMALVLFMGVFCAVAWRIYRGTPQEEISRAAMLPLEDERDRHVG